MHVPLHQELKCPVSVALVRDDGEDDLLACIETELQVLRGRVAGAVKEPQCERHEPSKGGSLASALSLMVS